MIGPTANIVKHVKVLQEEYIGCDLSYIDNLDDW